MWQNNNKNQKPNMENQHNTEIWFRGENITAEWVQTLMWELIDEDDDILR